MEFFQILSVLVTLSIIIMVSLCLIHQYGWKKVISIIAIVTTVCSIYNYSSIAFGATKDEMITIIRQAASDYRKNTGFEGQCTIAGEKVSLGAFMYSKLIQEGGRKDKYNNPFSLHASRGLFPLIKTVSKDGSKTRPHYRTPYEGTYEAIDLIVKNPLYKKCNMDYSTIKSYISGPNAKDSATNKARCIKGNCTIKAFATAKLSQNLINARRYDKTKDSVSDKPISKEQKQEVKQQGFDVVTNEKKCTSLGSTKAEWIQFDIHNPDTNTTELLDQKVLQLSGNEVVKMFKCWTK